MRADVAFVVFYRRHVAEVLRFCARRRLDACDAADVTAETFMSALRARCSYRSSEASAQAWLLGIANHRLADRGRRLRRERLLLRRLASERIVLSERDLADYAALCEEVDSTLSEALEALPADQRTAIEARVVHERDYKTVGTELHVTPAAARQRVSRGLATLRTRLKEER